MFKQKENYHLEDLLEIVTELRSEHGCPWDKEQNHESIRMDLAEEAYEVMEAIDMKSSEMLREELGDLLLQIAFHAELEREVGSFNFDDVCNDICQKLVYRHPHVFGEVTVNGTDDVLKTWDSLKKKSKNQDTYTATLESVPKNFPALMRGEKICKRASRAGLMNDDKLLAIAAAKEKLNELENAIKSENEDDIGTELGETLLDICNLSRILKKDSEKALTYSINKFIMRFRDFEENLSKRGKSLDELSEEERKAFSEK